MKLPIKLDKLLAPRSIFMLMALGVTVLIFLILNHERSSHNLSPSQKDSENAASPEKPHPSTTTGSTWAEAGKKLLGLEQKREEVTNFVQERFKKQPTEAIATVESPQKNMTTTTVKALSVNHQPAMPVSDNAEISPKQSSQIKPRQLRKPCRNCRKKKSSRHHKRGFLTNSFNLRTN